MSTDTNEIKKFRHEVYTFGLHTGDKLESEINDTKKLLDGINVNDSEMSGTLNAVKEKFVNNLSEITKHRKHLENDVSHIVKVSNFVLAEHEHVENKTTGDLGKAGGK